jgi:peptidyl-prolyl cis-trans isomerase A (cyclophilin A)
MRWRAFGTLIVAVIAGCCLARGLHAFVGQQTPATDSVKRERLSVPAQLTERAPDIFLARFDTSKGSFQIATHRDWSPRGADRFYNLVKNGFYDDCRVFRVIEHFLAEFGINGDPEIQKAWSGATIADDMVRQSNKRGFVAFMKAAPDSRSTRVFINVAENTFLDESYSPFGQVTAGMDVVDSFYAGYAGEPQKQIARVHAEGNVLLNRSFPKLDYILRATIVP